jgi:hypothetical protein
MRSACISIALATTLVWNFPQPTMAQQSATEPKVPIPENVDRGAFMCPWSIYTMIRGFQKNCHPDDEEFGGALEEPIGLLEKFIVANKWMDQQTIENIHEYADVGIVKATKDKPIRTKDGYVDDICKYADLEEMYQQIRKTLEAKTPQDVRRYVGEFIANPPLKKTPFGSPCL